MKKTSEVGSYEKIAPHPWNLCDMHGNVREWCDNLYAKKALSRVSRGGGWITAADHCRSASRNVQAVDGINHWTGFRLVIC